jgi:predicted nucleotidyltransferase
VNDWPGRRRAEASRQWPVLRETIDRVARLDVFAGVLALGSFAEGEPDELSDLDLIAVAVPGRFEDAWAARRQLAGDVLAAWESRGDSGRQLRWFTWLTRDLVKVECGVAAPGSRELAEPFAVLLGPPSVADAFPRIDRTTLDERAARIRADQQDFDPAEMTLGERIDWNFGAEARRPRSPARRVTACSAPWATPRPAPSPACVCACG